jgi:RecA-family ATPase
MPEVITARQLQAMVFPEPVWIVPGVIPEGMTMLAGKPKKGKSYLALNIALSISCGGKALGVSVQGVNIFLLSMHF